MRRGLQLQDVSLWALEQPLIERLSLWVAPAEIVTLMGESGVGKSTLLGFICGTLEVGIRASGRVLVDDRDITSLAAEQRRVGILFQDDLLFPHLSVGGNLAFGLSSEIRGSDRYERIARALEEADLAGFQSRDPATLSGGQCARVALMRALLAEPRVMLLDEPFSKLDNQTRERFRTFVFAHIKQRGIPVLMVTHDPQDALATGGRVVELRRSGQGAD